MIGRYATNDFSNLQPRVETRAIHNRSLCDEYVPMRRKCSYATNKFHNDALFTYERETTLKLAVAVETIQTLVGVWIGLMVALQTRGA